MAEQKYTIYQRLAKLFGPQGYEQKKTPTYNFDKKELLRTTSKQEFDYEKLQAQQTAYLNNQWHKVESNLYQQATYY